MEYIISKPMWNFFLKIQINLFTKRKRPKDIENKFMIIKKEKREEG